MEKTTLVTWAAIVLTWFGIAYVVDTILRRVEKKMEKLRKEEERRRLLLGRKIGNMGKSWADHISRHHLEQQAEADELRKEPPYEEPEEL
jgi:hypothetical protein